MDDPHALDLELSERLRARGQRVTSQRLVIHRALRARDAHLSAEQVFNDTRDRLPGMSLPTVYATLELLTELGLAHRFDAGTGSVLFDGRTEPHHHAVCRSCGTVIDLDAGLDERELRARARREGFRTDTLQAVLTGECARCSTR